jgi:hypothetical protein
VLLPPGQKLEIARINQWNFLNMIHVEGLSWILGFFKHSETNICQLANSVTFGMYTTLGSHHST